MKFFTNEFRSFYFPAISFLNQQEITPYKYQQSVNLIFRFSGLLLLHGIDINSILYQIRFGNW